MAKRFIISAELQALFLQNPKLKGVGFSEDGKHWLSPKKLITKEGDEEKDMKWFGQGTFSHKLEIKSRHTTEVIREDIAKGKPATEIVEFWTREEVLAVEPKVEASGFLNQFMNATDAELAFLDEFFQKRLAASQAVPQPTTNGITPASEEDGKDA